MAESTESELSTESTEEKQSPVDLQMTEFKLSDQITEKEKQSRVILWVLYTMPLDLYSSEYIIISSFEINHNHCG